VLVAAAVCPHPPLLIPAAMGAAGLVGRPDAAGPAGDAELRELRASCVSAVTALLAAGPDLLAVVGGAAAGATYDGPVAGSLRPFGIPCAIGTGEPLLPLSLTVGRWLLEQAGRDFGGAAGKARQGQPAGFLPFRVRLRAVTSDMATADCLRLGAEIAGLAPRVAMLAMGDASARKAVGVPGAADPAAERYDAGVAAALAAADAGQLARLDPAVDAELMIAGRAAWQVLAGAADGVPLLGRLHCAAAPFDVTYLVATWQAARRRPDPLAD
jgi:hypothetical protein